MHDFFIFRTCTCSAYAFFHILYLFSSIEHVSHGKGSLEIQSLLSLSLSHQSISFYVTDVTQRNGRNKEHSSSYPTAEDPMVWTSHATANPTPSLMCI